MKPISVFTALGLLFSTTVVAHPGPHAREDHASLMKRAAQSKNCARHVAEMNRKRMAKRGFPALDKRYPGSGNATYEITTEAPYYESIQNDTCVLVPEVTTGPYIWPRSQLLRQDMSEGEPGVPLYMDIGVLDVNTCEPLENALVDLWHCNATGSYSSFTGIDPNTPFGEILGNLTGGGAPNGTLDLHTDTTTFLRGMWPTDESGVMEIKTTFPGFYVERAIHIHVQVHLDWAVASNGTIRSGNTVSTGQIFFDDETENTLMALEPYSTHVEIERTLNSEDDIFADEQTAGFNSIMSVVPLDGVDIKNGVIGYITLGVDPTHTSDPGIAP